MLMVEARGGGGGTYQELKVSGAAEGSVGERGSFFGEGSMGAGEQVSVCAPRVVLLLSAPPDRVNTELTTSI